MDFFLITTNHLLKDILFRDDDDFRVAMNYVAIAAFVTGVYVLAFILMSNHTHFVAACPYQKAILFSNHFKTLYGRYYARKYETKNFLRRLGVDYKQVWQEDESLIRAIAYVQMNCVAANICPYSNMYRWGTGSVFFNDNQVHASNLGEMSETKQAKMLHSNVSLPKNYKVCDEGYILPESYIPVKYVEEQFISSNRYLFFLNKSSKAKAHLEKDAAPSFSDQVLVAAVRDLCRSLYRCSGFNELTEANKSDLIKNIKSRFSADISQIGRILSLSYEEVVKMIDMV